MHALRLVAVSTLLAGCTGRPAESAVAETRRYPSTCECLAGRLGHPLGTYLEVEGVRNTGGMTGSSSLLVDTVAGVKLETPVSIPVENVRGGALPRGERCVIRGYESARMIGLPLDVARAENMPLPQACWQLYRTFMMTSVREPEGLVAEVERHADL